MMRQRHLFKILVALIAATSLWPASPVFAEVPNFSLPKRDGYTLLQAFLVDRMGEFDHTIMGTGLYGKAEVTRWNLKSGEDALASPFHLLSPCDCWS